MRGNPDDGELLAVAQHFRRDRLARLQFEIHDEIGDHHGRRSVNPENEVFVLDRDASLRPRMVADAGQHRLPHRKPAPKLPAHVGDFAGEEEGGAGFRQQSLDDVMAPCSRVENRAPDFERLRQSAGNGDPLDICALHRRRGEARRGAHIDRDMASETLEPEHIDDFLEDDDIALVVGDRSWRRIEPVDEESRHLDFGKRPAHPVAVDDGEARVGGSEDRFDGIGAANFRRYESGDAHVHRLLNPAQRPQTFLALLDFLDAHDRRADAADRADDVVVVHSLKRKDLHRRSLAEQFARSQHPDIRIASAPSPEQRSPQRQRQEIGLLEDVAPRRHASLQRLSLARASRCPADRRAARPPHRRPRSSRRAPPRPPRPL